MLLSDFASWCIFTANSCQYSPISIQWPYSILLYIFSPKIYTDDYNYNCKDTCIRSWYSFSFLHREIIFFTFLGLVWVTLLLKLDSLIRSLRSYELLYRKIKPSIFCIRSSITIKKNGNKWTIIMYVYLYIRVQFFSCTNH